MFNTINAIVNKTRNNKRKKRVDIVKIMNN